MYKTDYPESTTWRTKRKREIERQILKENQLFQPLAVWVFPAQMTDTSEEAMIRIPGPATI